jgi:hypothetical protein
VTGKRAITQDMAFQKHKLAALIDFDATAAADEIASKYRDAQASQKGAAELLECSEPTLIRWIRRLDVKLGKNKMTKRLEAIKAQALKEGWHHARNRMGGRPPGGPVKKRKTRAAHA